MTLDKGLLEVVFVFASAGTIGCLAQALRRAVRQVKQLENRYGIIYDESVLSAHTRLSALFALESISKGIAYDADNPNIPLKDRLRRLHRHTYEGLLILKRLEVLDARDDFEDDPNSNPAAYPREPELKPWAREPPKVCRCPRAFAGYIFHDKGCPWFPPDMPTPTVGWSARPCRCGQRSLSGLEECLFCLYPGLDRTLPVPSSLVCRCSQIIAPLATHHCPGVRFPLGQTSYLCTCGGTVAVKHLDLHTCSVLFPASTASA